MDRAASLSRPFKACKSNIRNLQIYREALRGERRPLEDLAFILFVDAMLLLILIIPLLGLIYLVRLLQTIL